MLSEKELMGLQELYVKAEYLWAEHGNKDLIIGVSEEIPNLINEIRRLQKENTVLKAEPCDELEWCGTTKDGRDMYCLKAGKEDDNA